MKRTLSCLFAVQIFFLAQRASCAETPQGEVNALMQRYNEVEAQLARSIHYVNKEGVEPETLVQQAWFNAAGGLLKVSTERTGAAGRELKEYFPEEPDENPKAMRMFVLIRREIPRPDGATRVDEERVYLRRSESAGLLTLRKLTKSAEFKAGQPLDMEYVRNVVAGPAKREPTAITEEASKRDWDFMEEPKTIAQALRTAGAPQNELPVQTEDAAPGEQKPRWVANSVSPDGKWELALAEADEEEGPPDRFVVRERGSEDTSVALSEEASGTFAESTKILWAPDSKRFAFHYKPGLRYQTLQLFQLDRSGWRELDSPDEDSVIDAPIKRSMAAQRKKLKLSPQKIGRPISAGCEVRKWVDSRTALLLVDKNETFQINNDLEQVGESSLSTLKFDSTGNWKVTRTRLLSGAETAAFNQVEQEELDKMGKESEESN